jgi:hypothetical protein
MALSQRLASWWAAGEPCAPVSRAPARGTRGDATRGRAGRRLWPRCRRLPAAYGSPLQPPRRPAAGDRDTFITINNKAEGSAPLSVLKLAAAIVNSRAEE